jgi:hypothetical protein
MKALVVVRFWDMAGWAPGPRRASDPKYPRDPSRAGLRTIGLSFDFIWNLQQDLNAFVQEVKDEGEFSCTGPCGETNWVKWTESYIEAWVLPNPFRIPQKKVDFHRAGPQEPAKHLDVVCKVPCDYAQEWKFSMKATFRVVNAALILAPGFFNKKNTFEKTEVCVLGSTGATSTFNKMLYPGAKVVQLVFPPPQTAGQLFKDEDEWSIVHADHARYATADYTCTGYAAQP